jgi:hypothetical protein
LIHDFAGISGLLREDFAEVPVDELTGDDGVWRPKT